MAIYEQRLKALEAVRKVKSVIPLVILVPKDGLTDNQKLGIMKAKMEGRNVIEIILDKSIKTEWNSGNFFTPTPTLESF